VVWPLHQKSSGNELMAEQIHKGHDVHVNGGVKGSQLAAA
jgi:hypothetical protein